MTRDPVQEIRTAASAGKYYPAEPDFLAKVTDNYLAGARPMKGPSPKAVIAPHGGFVFSGAVAGQAFGAWRHEEIKRVVLIGPSHFFDFPGLALPGAAAFQSPLGITPVDEEWSDRLERFSFVRVFAAPHEQEHALEVQLPFLQRLAPEAKIIPLITGRASDLQVMSVLQQLWGGAETRIIVSSDLSHFLDYAAAKKVDGQTAALVETFEYRKLTVEQACGCVAIRGFLRAALEREMKCQCVDLRNSAETAGVETDLVGFGAFHFHDA
jgi:AmmeMemoRadiSam system protein B